MAIELNLWFVDEATGKIARDVEGYNFGDFFEPDDAIARAEAAGTPEAATEILTAAYIGADTENIGVRWSPKKYE